MVSRLEWKVLMACFAVVELVTAVPLLVGVASQSASERFMGFADKVPDSVVYLTAMRQGAEGHLFFQNDFTLGRSPRALAHVLFMLMGQLCALIHFPLNLGFHLFRVAFGFAFLLAASRFFRACCPDERVRALALAFLSFGAGLGWLLYPLFPQVEAFRRSVDLWMPEATGFYSMMLHPHFCASNALMLLLFALVLEGQQQTNPRRFGQAAAIAFVLAVVHPYHVVTVDVAVLAVLVWAAVAGQLSPRQAASAYLLVFAGSLPVMAYQYWSFHSNPAMVGWLRQNVLRSPSPVSYLSGYGPLLLLAMLGYREVRAGRVQVGSFPVVWILTIAVLVYAPIQFQRRLVQGVEAPLSLLSAVGVMGSLNGFESRDSLSVQPRGLLRRRLTLAFALLAVFPSNLVVWWNAVHLVGIRLRCFYLTNGELECARWLRNSVGEGEPVLSLPHLGLYLPALVGTRSFVGHRELTANFEEKKRLADRFFQPTTSDSFRRKLLSAYGIRFVVFGRDEREKGLKTLRGLPFLHLMFSSPEAEVYQYGELAPIPWAKTRVRAFAESQAGCYNASALKARGSQPVPRGVPHGSAGPHQVAGVSRAPNAVPFCSGQGDRSQAARGFGKV